MKSFIVESRDLFTQQSQCRGCWWSGDRWFQHADVSKWKHFPRYWLFVWGIHWSLVNSLHKGQRRGALMFSVICAWINGWVNNREPGDLRFHCAHYDVIVMKQSPAMLLSKLRTPQNLLVLVPQPMVGGTMKNMQGSIKLLYGIAFEILKLSKCICSSVNHEIFSQRLKLSNSLVSAPEGLNS